MTSRVGGGVVGLGQGRQDGGGKGGSGSNCKANTEYLCDTFGLAFIFVYLSRVPARFAKSCMTIRTMLLNCFLKISSFNTF